MCVLSLLNKRHDDDDDDDDDDDELMVHMSIAAFYFRTQI